MKDKTNLLTLCFFEYPKALYEINEWHKRFIDYIEVFERINGNHTMKFVIDRKDLKAKEFVFCIDSKNEVIDKLEEFVHLHSNYEVNIDTDYFKTILFGSFKTKELRLITSIVDIFEEKCKQIV